LLILMSLAEEPRHGYALTQDIADFAGVTLGPGTLYGAISRLEERGHIAPVASSDPRRRPYRITPSGRRALSAALTEMRKLTNVGLARLAANSA
jgi:DNA-binding PadR family transcriptional regulator